jgi:hypothetical protein
MVKGPLKHADRVFTQPEPEADCRLRPVLMGTNLLEKFMRFGTAAFALLLLFGVHHFLLSLYICRRTL